MKLDFDVWLKLAVDRLLKPKTVVTRGSVNALLIRDDDRDRSAREYELHYWGTMPGIWY
ncbi:hypothetical protein GA0061105_104131 [Rhizobium aethiopicum]|uniref:Uncharacterized protein n=1 Tax=Rhizobium aethiopicum TaxID=1138170 RepID=A0A1C3Y153_9HYPH|nr:hypothetical protein [Rhizobium aethiopicum]SCB58207.1 hypothetical protein GA0061105_104131 [Rhizobium aethiopicum]